MIEILKAELAHRDQNIATYRINIAKYERMAARIEAAAPGYLADFSSRLCELLKTEREQCAIEELTRDVTAEILTEMQAK